jgi:hypothetical protein
MGRWETQAVNSFLPEYFTLTRLDVVMMKQLISEGTGSVWPLKHSWIRFFEGFSLSLLRFEGGLIHDRQHCGKTKI